MKRVSKFFSALAIVSAAGISSASAGGEVNNYQPAIWSGFYAGIHGGYAEAKYDGIFDSNGDSGYASDLDLDGGIAGIHIGYNWQRGNIVLGLEADVTAGNLSDAVSDRDGDDDITAGDIDLLASVRGRLGVTSGTLMVYATGGIAFSNAEYYVEDTDGGDRSSGTASFDNVGYVVGGGFEKMYTQSGIRLRVEGLYYGFDDTIDTSNLAPTDSDDGDFAKFEDVWSVRVGISVPLGSSK